MSKSHRVQAAALSLFLLGFGLASVALAATPTTALNLNVMLVDIQTLLQKSKVSQMVRHQIEAKRAQYTREIAAAEEKLNKEKDQLQRAQSSLSPAALNQREIKFQQELNAFKLSYRGKVEALQRSSNEAFTKIQQALLQIIGKFAKQRKASLVFNRGELLFWDKSLDATDEVLKDLDTQLPSLKVSFVSPAAAPAPGPSAAPRRR